jgi:hypothetical protein
MSTQISVVDCVSIRRDHFNTSAVGGLILATGSSVVAILILAQDPALDHYQTNAVIAAASFKS